MINAFGSLRNSMLSGVIDTSSCPRRSTRTSRARRMPSPVSNFGSISPSPPANAYSRIPKNVKLLDQPFQELHRLGDFVDGEMGRMVADIGDQLADAREHRAPVLNDHAHIGEHQLERAHRLRPAQFVLDALDVDMDEA